MKQRFHLNTFSGHKLQRKPISLLVVSTVGLSALFLAPSISVSAYAAALQSQQASAHTNKLQSSTRAISKLHTVSAVSNAVNTTTPSRVLTDDKVKNMAGCEAVIEGDTVVLRPKNNAKEAVLSGYNNNETLRDKQTDFEAIQRVLKDNYTTIRKVRVEGKIYAYKSIAGLFNLSGSDGSPESSTNRFLHLQSLGNLGDIDVSNVTNMYRLFKRCVEIKDVSTLKNWNVSRVEQLGELFRDCTKLADLSGIATWNVSSVKSMDYIVSGTNITNTSAFSSWKTDSLTSASGLVAGCKNLTDLTGLSQWNVSNVTNMQAAFAGCDKLESLHGLETWNTGKLQYTRGLLSFNPKLKDISALGKWNVQQVQELTGAFNNCTSLEDVSALANWNTSSLTDLSYTFAGSTKIKNIDEVLSHWDTSKVTDMEHAFTGVPSNSLSSILDVSNKTFANASSMGSYADFNGVLLANNWQGAGIASITRAMLFGTPTTKPYPTYLLLTNNKQLLQAFKNEVFTTAITLALYDTNGKELVKESLSLPAVYDTSNVPDERKTKGLTLAEYVTQVVKPHVDKAIAAKLEAIKKAHPNLAISSEYTPSKPITSSPVSLFQTYKLHLMPSNNEDFYALHAMYRLYNPYTHEHLFTTDAAEKDNLVSLGWNFEGITGKVYMHGEKGGVYRLYNPNTGEHHYTTKEDEVAACVKAGWRNEGVKFFSVLDEDKQTVGMVSMYNPYEKKFYHHYTSDADEIAKMVKDGWRKEEIKWYAAK